MKKHKLVLNYSTMSLWSKGRIDEAIDCYFRMGLYDSEAMRAGRAFHKAWEKEIKKTHTLVFGNTTVSFHNPRCEHLIYTPYSDRYDLKGTMDCLDGETLYEFKTGKTSALDFASTMQIPLYFLLNEMTGNPLSRGILLHFNQHDTTHEYVVVLNSEEKMESARNFIETIAPEIETYFDSHGLSYDPAVKPR